MKICLTVVNVEALLVPKVSIQVQVQLQRIHEAPLWVVGLLHLWDRHTE